MSCERELLVKMFEIKEELLKIAPSVWKMADLLHKLSRTNRVVDGIPIFLDENYLDDELIAIFIESVSSKAVIAIYFRPNGFRIASKHYNVLKTYENISKEQAIDIACQKLVQEIKDE